MSLSCIPRSPWSASSCCLASVGRRHAGKLPHSLLCRPTWWPASFEESAHSARFDQEARLLPYEKPFDFDVCASQSKSAAAHCTTARKVVLPGTLSRNTISRQAVNSSRRCLRWRGPQSICCEICRGGPLEATATGCPNPQIWVSHCDALRSEGSDISRPGWRIVRCSR